MTEKTIFDAMEEFANIAQAVAFSSNEIALFYALLQSWNAARRPTVIEQWARTTCHAAGMEEKTLRSTRNKLVQRGVIHFQKSGYRGVPKYSLTALFNLPPPFEDDLPVKKAGKSDTKSDTKRAVKVTLKGRSYQEKEKIKNNPLPPSGGGEDAQVLPHGRAFKQAWSDWLEHLKQKRKNPTELAKSRQLKKLAAMSELEAVEAIDHSITNNWQGIFPPARKQGINPEINKKGRNQYV